MRVTVHGAEMEMAESYVAAPPPTIAAQVREYARASDGRSTST